MSPVAYLRDAHEGEGDECLVPAAKGDPGSFPVYDYATISDPFTPTERAYLLKVLGGPLEVEGMTAQDVLVLRGKLEESA